MSTNSYLPTSDSVFFNPLRASSHHLALKIRLFGLSQFCSVYFVLFRDAPTQLCFIPLLSFSFVEFRVGWWTLNTTTHFIFQYYVYCIFTEKKKCCIWWSCSFDFVGSICMCMCVFIPKSTPFWTWMSAEFKMDRRKREWTIKWYSRRRMERFSIGAELNLRMVYCTYYGHFAASTVVVPWQFKWTLQMCNCALIFRSVYLFQANGVKPVEEPVVLLHISREYMAFEWHIKWNSVWRYIDWRLWAILNDFIGSFGNVQIIEGVFRSLSSWIDCSEL